MDSQQLRDLVAGDPAKALELLQKLRNYVVQPHGGGQKEVYDNPTRFKVLNCGRRWGKTKLGVKMMMREAMGKPLPGHKEKLVWWVAPTYKVVKRGYAETLRQLPRELLLHDPPPETNFDAGRSVTLRLTNGNKIEFYSAERPGGMLGEGIQYAVIDEAATIPSTVWEQIIRPTLMDTKGGGCLISTPRGRNWFHKRWKAGQDPLEPEWASWTFTSFDNPHIDNSEIEQMKRELPSLIFDQEALAKFIADGSNVFAWDDRALQPNPVNERTHMVEGIKPKGHVFLGVDLARTNDYTVFYGTNESNMRNVYFERLNALRWKEQKRRLRRAVNRIMEAGAEAVTLVMDETGVGQPIVEDMEDAGYDVVGVNFTGDKNKMVSRLAKDLETGRAFLLENAHIEEFEDYQLSTTPAGRIQFSAPEGDHDDVVSAKMLSHWGITTEGSPDVNMIGPGTPVEHQQGDEDPDDIDYADDGETGINDWSDLIDGASELDDTIERLGLPESIKQKRQPTPEELLARGSGPPDAWS